jgi:hypothetical protein
MLFIGTIGIILAIGIGVKLSENIDEFIIVFLFWLLYIVTIATFINIVLVVNYYLTMRNKTGIQGKSGDQGDPGDPGKSGICDPGCRDSICQEGILEKISELLKEKVRSDKGIDPNTVRFNNIYIKGKVKQMCSSKEFKQLVPYNGPQNLINYLNDIWTLWFNELYDAGGLPYFENIAAETEFEWKTDNPFNELKKYDVFYWGLGKQYRPNIVDKCYSSNDGTNIYNGTTDNQFSTAITNMYSKLGKTNPDNLQISFWRADQFTFDGSVYYPVGDIIIGPVGYHAEDKDTNASGSKYVGEYNDSVIMERHVGDFKYSNRAGPNRETILVTGNVKGPVSYEMMWNNADESDGTEETDKFWIWRPIPPTGYIALGDIVSFDSASPSTGDNAPIRCVPADLAIRTSPPTNKNIKVFNSGAYYKLHDIDSSKKKNISILVFHMNNTGPQNVDLYTGPTHCYNLFRTTIASNKFNISITDTNSNFYYLDTNKYDATATIAANYGDPSTNKTANKVGKGYIPFPVKDSRYSIMPYLNLKNNVTLVHNKTKIPIYGSLIQSAISNSYSINTRNNNSSCLNFENNSITLASCDTSMSSQSFSIKLTGNLKNECNLQHNDTQNILSYVNGVFTLINQNSTDNTNELFIMQ